jgi:hypothetical protein
MYNPQGVSGPCRWWDVDPLEDTAIIITAAECYSTHGPHGPDVALSYPHRAGLHENDFSHPLYGLPTSRSFAAFGEMIIT